MSNKRSVSRLWKGLFVFMAAVLLCAAPDTDVQAKKKIKVKKVTVKSNYGKSVHVAVGKKIKLTTTVKVTPNKSANKKVTYKSSNKKIATVSSVGNVKGVKRGSCKITVTSKKNKKKKAKISVKVVKQVTKVKLNTTSAMIYAGNSMTLKATLSPTSGSYKKVTWSTSDKSVATVSKDGVVKGVGAGTVKIKATSVEGTKKSETCTIKVLAANTINLSSVQILSKHVVRVTLDKARVLTAGNFAVEGKRYTVGTYTRRFKISQVRNYDNKTYDLTLDNTYSISQDSYVRVSIASLPGNGTKSMEAQAVFVKSTAPVTKNWIGVVGDEWNETIDLSDYCYGNISYDVTGSIGGITHKASENALIFSGSFDTVTVGTVMTIHAVDELENEVTQKVNVYVGNESTVVAKAEDMTVLAGKALSEKAFAEAAGGSGSYLYEAEGLPTGLELNEDGTVSGTVTRSGEYKVQVTVSDKENPVRTFKTSAVIKSMEEKKVSGKVMDESGRPVAGAVVTCTNVNDNTVFTGETDATGAYDVYVAEGTYDIRAEKDGTEDHVYSIDVGSAGRQISFIVN